MIHSRQFFPLLMSSKQNPKQSMILNKSSLDANGCSLSAHRVSLRVCLPKWCRRFSMKMAVQPRSNPQHFPSSTRSVCPAMTRSCSRLRLAIISRILPAISARRLRKSIPLILRRWMPAKLSMICSEIKFLFPCPDRLSPVTHAFAGRKIRSFNSGFQIWKLPVWIPR